LRLRRTPLRDTLSLGRIMVCAARVALVPRKSSSNRVIVHRVFVAAVMSRKVEVWDPGEIARQWRELAERRRAHFIELYRSGRWRRYYDEQDFLACVRKVTAEIESWDALAGPELPAFRKAS
jgi:hypothetical protein